MRLSGASIARSSRAPPAFRCLELTEIVDTRASCRLPRSDEQLEAERQIRHRLAVLRHAEELTGNVCGRALEFAFCDRRMSRSVIIESRVRRSSIVAVGGVAGSS
jgi:hypothetical protein